MTSTINWHIFDEEVPSCGAGVLVETTRSDYDVVMWDGEDFVTKDYEPYGWDVYRWVYLSEL